MARAFDEAVTTGLQRGRTAAEILTDLIRAEGRTPIRGQLWPPIDTVTTASRS